tara:strand:- start:148 stop:309 length:162 start_codon:yes stop_codon:yes gene_type:complete
MPVSMVRDACFTIFSFNSVDWKSVSASIKKDLSNMVDAAEVIDTSRAEDFYLP